ncbi:MAG: class I SAM-dependent methyltransferase [Halothece sp. Uz-M2-17]|nr:class I SAM-dependent methyltransferase [Halothece sp. Uz-M2-17]
MTKTKRDWKNYYKAIEDRPPRKTILTALANFEKPGFAIDLGCGTGRDTVEILRQGWRVLAIDKEAEAIAKLKSKFYSNKQLIVQVSSFEELQIIPPVDLINASFCLPFCSPDFFPTLWNNIFNSLRNGGRFCGHLFGDRDSWKEGGLIHCQTRSQVETLLNRYNIELLEEEEHPGKTPLGEDRYWHVFHIVAKKP